jgi:hypothetical protein
MKTTYDPALRETEHGKRLYQLWRRVKKSKHSADFDKFPDFYDWAMDAGYSVADRLVLIDNEKPFSPENCCFVMPYAEEKEWIEKWNRTVNHLRKQWGLPPLEEKR